MDSKESHRKVFTRRAALLAGAQGLAMAVLGGRLYYLGVLESEQYEMLAEENRISIRLLAPPRGTIVDRFGADIATNRQDYRVFLIPEQAKSVHETLQRLGRIIRIDERDRLRIERQIAKQRGFLPVTVAEGLDWPSFAEINVATPTLPGIQPDAGLTRWYPDGPSASQVVGYVGVPDPEDVGEDPLLRVPGFKVGKRGIERAFDRVLRGGPGSARVEVNASGRVIRELARVEGEKGGAVSLTLDMALQRAASERLGEEAAGVVVLDVYSGEVYVHASTPSYDPNVFSSGISRENWRALLEDPRKPLVDKCLSGQYPPGSTFKMVVALAALHHGVVEPDETTYCGGTYRLGDNVWHCWRERGHGNLALVDAIARSCDIYFYTIARRLGIERIAAFARDFGLGETFGLEVGGESAGLVPSPAWKRAVTGQPWLGGETLNVGIGQGQLLATPMQLAVMTARIANGGRQVTPHLVRSVGGQRAPVQAVWPVLQIDDGDLALVRRGMEKVLEPRGTAYLSRLEVDGQRMAGKTGTSQVRRITAAQRAAKIEQQALPWKERHHAWFVAYAPMDAPRYAACILIEHGGGGASAAAPVARDIMAEVLRRDPARRPPADRPLTAEADPAPEPEDRT